MYFPPLRQFTLGSFIPKKGNQLARAEGIYFTGAQQRSPNILILAGTPGAGKTHLVHALSNFAKRNEAIRSITCLSAVQFTNEITRAEFYGDKAHLLRRMARDDFLAIDDVDRLCNQPTVADALLGVLKLRQTEKKRTLLSATLSLSPPNQSPLAEFLDRQPAVAII